MNSGYGSTNHEIVNTINPTKTRYAMPYIYDDLSWSHCQEDFEGLFLLLSEGTTPKPSLTVGVIDGFSHAMLLLS